MRERATWGLGEKGTWDMRTYRSVGKGFFSFSFSCKIQKHYILESFTTIARVRLHKEENNLRFSSTATCVPLDVFVASWIFPLNLFFHSFSIL